MKQKVVLAYSGGLDTSIILKWLSQVQGYDVVAYTADVGQGEDQQAIEKKAYQLGASQVFVEDLRESFVGEYVFPAYRANPLYEGAYLLGTSIARPVIAKKQVEIAKKVGATAVAHGATGKGNDQVRFELAFAALAPHLEVIAPWRTWSFKGREDLIDFARDHQIPIAKDKMGEAPFSVDANLLHSSSEGKSLEDPGQIADDRIYQRIPNPVDAPDQPEDIIITYRKGDPVALNGKELSPANMLAALNEKACTHGIGRLDLVESRFIGMKSRGLYETPGGTLMITAHRDLESLCLDREVIRLKMDIMPRYAELIYNGFWFSHARELLQGMIDQSQEFVTGSVTLRLYKGSCQAVARTAEKSLYSLSDVSFEASAEESYNQKDAEGFIRLQGLRLRIAGKTQRKFDR